MNNSTQHSIIVYLLGLGCKPDSYKAREWFEAAANQGDAEAQLYLGIMLVEGKAGQDFVTPKHWFQEAANQGIDRAQSSLHFLLSSQSSGSGHATEQLDLSYTWNKRKTKTA